MYLAFSFYPTYVTFADVFPYCGLYVVGSSMNGFGGVKSDMDMCLMICQQEVHVRDDQSHNLVHGYYLD